MNRHSHASLDRQPADILPGRRGADLIDGLPRRTVLAAGCAIGVLSVLNGYAKASEPMSSQPSLPVPPAGVDENASRSRSLNGLENGDHFAQLNGVDLAFRIRGAGPVLFVVSPGWGTGSSYLQKGFEFLQSRFRLVFVDTRGSGRSGRPADAGKMGSSDMADDIEALRDHLGLARVPIIGHSNSGAIVLYYAERYPDHASKVVLVCSQVIGLDWIKDTRVILRQRSDDPRYSEAVRTATDYFDGKLDPGKTDAELTAFVGRILPLYLERPEVNLPQAREDLAGAISSYAFRAQNAADAAAHIDQAGALGQVKANVLIMAGRKDWICPIALSERLHDDIINSRLVVFEQSGHFPWMEERDKFRRELTQFLGN
jgi:pimeloyl-ACP methyl ester carboxylesterase